MMNIAIPAAAILAVIIIAYFATKKMGIAIRFHLLLICGLIGLFLGLMLPRILLPQLSLAITLLILMIFMILLSIVLAWVFAKDEIDDEKTAFATSVSENTSQASSFKEKIEQVTTTSSEKLGLGKLQQLLFEEVIVKEENLPDIEEILKNEEFLSLDETTEQNNITNDDDDYIYDDPAQEEIPVLIADEVALSNFENESEEPAQVLYPKTEADEKDNIEEIFENRVEEIDNLSDDIEETEEFWTTAEFDISSINTDILDVTEYSSDIKISPQAVISSNKLSEYDIKQSAHTESFGEEAIYDADTTYISANVENDSYNPASDDTSYEISEQADYTQEAANNNNDLTENNMLVSSFEAGPATIDNLSSDINTDTYSFDKDELSDIDEENQDTDTDGKPAFFAEESAFANNDKSIYVYDDNASAMSTDTIDIAEIDHQEINDISFADREANISENPLSNTNDDAPSGQESTTNDFAYVNDSNLEQDKIFTPIDKDYMDIPVFSISESLLSKTETVSAVITEENAASQTDEAIVDVEDAAYSSNIDKESAAHLSVKDEGDLDNVVHHDDDRLPYSRLTASLEKIMPAVNDEPASAINVAKQMPVPKSDSIDDILDFAFEQKEEGNPDAAIMALNIAYDMYMHMESSIPVIVEIANIYKAQGNYKDAIAALQKGFNNISNEAIRQDFILNIAYLRIIRNILSTNNLGLLPYNQIPVKVKEEIEKEFNEWKKGFK